MVLARVSGARIVANHSYILSRSSLVFMFLFTLNIFLLYPDRSVGGSDAREPRPVRRRVGSSSKLCIKCRCRAKMLCGTHAQCYFWACENDIHYIISFSSEYLLHQFVVIEIIDS